MFKITKTVDSRKTNITYEISHPNLKSGYCSGFHGYSGFEESHWNKVIECLPKDKKANIKTTYDNKVEFSFTVSVETLELADINFIFKAGKTDSGKAYKYANVDVWNGGNQYFKTINVHEMLNHMSDTPVLVISDFNH